jgi:hypothetical protein
VPSQHFILVAGGRHLRDKPGDINRLAAQKPKESPTSETRWPGQARPVIRTKHTLSDETTLATGYEMIRLTSHLYLLMLRAGSAGGGFGERGSAKGATACRNRHITETFRAFFGGRVGSDFSAPHSGQNRVHRQHDKKI